MDIDLTGLQLSVYSECLVSESGRNLHTAALYLAQITVLPMYNAVVPLDALFISAPLLRQAVSGISYFNWL